MANRQRYNHRMLLPREADMGYARHLSQSAGTFIEQHEGKITLLRNGEKLLVTADVRELVKLLRDLLNVGA